MRGRIDLLRRVGLLVPPGFHDFADLELVLPDRHVDALALRRPGGDPFERHLTLFRLRRPGAFRQTPAVVLHDLGSRIGDAEEPRLTREGARPAEISAVSPPHDVAEISADRPPSRVNRG